MKYLILFYQKYLSRLSGQSCRYYPSCSSYALILFKKEFFLLAIFKIIIRILKCNQLFVGGIEYPVVQKKFSNICYKRINVKYWYIPVSNGYTIVPTLKGIKK